MQAGYDYDEETFENIFRRIYGTFGSAAPYNIFHDSQPFLRWLRQKGLKVGLVSNAEYRYQDVILPSLGLNKVIYQRYCNNYASQRLKIEGQVSNMFYFKI